MIRTERRNQPITVTADGTIRLARKGDPKGGRVIYIDEERGTMRCTIKGRGTFDVPYPPEQNSP